MRLPAISHLPQNVEMVDLATHPSPLDLKSQSAQVDRRKECLLTLRPGFQKDVSVYSSSLDGDFDVLVVSYKILVRRTLCFSETSHPLSIRLTLSLNSLHLEGSYTIAVPCEKPGRALPCLFNRMFLGEDSAPISVSELIDIW